MERVLIVDDSPTETFLMSNWLNKAGFEVLTAESGEEGIETAKKEQPNLVLMDIVMPGMNGFQATRHLAKDEATSDIPVVIVTTKDQDTDRLWGERQGAKAFLTKPIDEKLLLRTIKSLI